MSDVFISYSRRDRDFMKILYDALETRQFTSWVDWEDIPKGTDWMSEIYSGIESADTFVLIVSPDSLASEVCNREIAYALKHHKRILPIIYREVEERQLAGEWFNKPWEETARGNWLAIKHINWLYLRTYDEFEVALTDLLNSLKTDSDHVKFHTRITVRAREWEENGQKSAYLLRGDDLITAEGWLAISRSKEPQPTNLHVAYIQSSAKEHAREQAERQARQERELVLQQRSANRLRYLAESLAVFLIVAIALSGFALGQQRKAQRNAYTATFALGQSEQRGTEVAEQAETAIAAQATSERRADVALSKNMAAEVRRALDEGKTNLALALALEAVSIPDPPPIAQEMLGIAADSIVTPRHIFEGHSNLVSCVAFSPDGRTALSGSWDTTLRLWDVATGKTLRVFRGHEWGVTSVAFSPDGRTALSGSSDTTLRLWKMATGETLRVFEGHSDVVTSVAFSPDGYTALSGSSDATLRLWDVATGETLRVFRGHTDGVTSVTFSPDGHTALSGAGTLDTTLRLWDVVTGTTLRVFWGHEWGVTSVAFSPDGHTALSGSEDSTLRLWDVATGTTLRVFEGLYGVTSMAFSPDGHMALVSHYTLTHPTLQLWDIETGESLRFFEGHRESIMSVAFSPDGRTFLTGSVDTTLGLWVVMENQSPDVFRGHSNDVQSVAFSPDGRTALSGARDTTLRLWDVATGETLHVFRGHSNNVWMVAFSPDGRTALSASLDSTLRLWDVTTGETLRVFRGHEGFVWDVAFSPDGRTALSGSSDTTLRLWDVATGKTLRVFQGHSQQVNSIAFNPDGRTALSASLDSTLRLWDVATGKTLRVFQGHTNAVTGVAFSPNGRTALSASGDNTLRLWDVATGMTLRVFEGHTDGVAGVAFSPNGRTALSASADHTLRLWDVATGETLRVFEGHTDVVTSVAFSPDGRTALSTSDDLTLRRWQIYTLEELVQWIYTNYDVYEITCDERRHYNTFVQCDESDHNPTRTPFPPITVSPYPTAAIPVWTPVARFTSTPFLTPNATSRAGVQSDEPIFGPASGELQHNAEDGLVAIARARVTVSDFVTEVRFYNPYDAVLGSWDYGLFFRATDESQYRLILSHDSDWDLKWYSGGDFTPLAHGTLADLDTNGGGSNLLRLEVSGGTGVFYVNATLVSFLDVQAATASGDIYVVTGAYQGDERTGEFTGYENFTVWPLGVD